MADIGRFIAVTIHSRGGPAEHHPGGVFPILSPPKNAVDVAIRWR